MNSEFIKKLTDIVEANLANEKFGIEDVAREMGMSHTSLHRKLKSTSNQSISQFIREIRLKRARELLRNGNLTVSEISYRVGFGSPTYFNKCFHEYFGYPPGESKSHEFHADLNSKPGKSFLEKVKSTKILISLIIGLIVIIAVVFYLANTGLLSKKENVTDKSIAVLPFNYLSNEVDKQYLAEGMMEAITLHLSKIKNLRVMPRTSVEQYRGTTKTTRQIGKELEVGYLLEGSFQKYGDHAKLIVQLIKAREESHKWGNEYNIKWSDVFPLQSEVAQKIASELNAAISPEEKRLIEKIPTANLAAYDLYLRAKDYEKEYWKTMDLSFFQKAATLYKAAIGIDSTFAKAYAGLASANYNRYYKETYFKKNFLDSCLILANKALSIDDQLEEAYYLKGSYYFDNGRIEEAMENTEKALKINPNYYLAYEQKGIIIANVLHDHVKGIENYNKALMLIRGDERPGLLRELGRLYRNVGFIDKAKYYFQEAFDLDGNDLYHLYFLAWIEFCNENFEEAYKLVKKREDIDSINYTEALAIFYSITPGHNEEAYLFAKKLIEYYKKSGILNLGESHRIGYAFWQVGKYKEAEYYFNQAIKYSEEAIKLGRDVSPGSGFRYNLAATYAFTGDKEKAYQYLDEYSKSDFCSLIGVIFLKHDPMFASIRNEERFQKIVRNMEAKYQAGHERVRKWLEVQKML